MSHGESHRDAVGGMWDEIGRLQFNFMVEMGLEPHHRLLDIGCGSLRGGVHFIEYLEPGNYYGMDKDRGLIDAGMAIELPKAGLGDKQATFSVNSEFAFHVFKTTFDFAIAQSLFTHLPWNSIVTCLYRVRNVLVPDGRLYATFFTITEYIEDWSKPVMHPGGIVTHPDKDPYHYDPTMLMGHVHGLDSEYIGDWGHPRGQYMMEYTRR